MFLMKWTRKFSVVATTVLVLAAATVLPNVAMAKNGNGNGGPAVVVLTASWCATCREITPAVQRVIQSNPQLGLKLVTLDVDSSSAPSQASGYGITVSGGDVPQVFLSNNGKTVLLFNGRGYKFGHAKQVETQIQDALNNNL